MSKIGKIDISIPEKVKVAIAGNILNIEGPLGKKSLNIDLNMFYLDIKDGKVISIKPKKILKLFKKQCLLQLTKDLELLINQELMILNINLLEKLEQLRSRELVKERGNWI